MGREWVLPVRGWKERRDALSLTQRELQEERWLEKKGWRLWVARSLTQLRVRPALPPPSWGGCRTPWSCCFCALLLKNRPRLVPEGGPGCPHATLPQHGKSSLLECPRSCVPYWLSWFGLLQQNTVNWLAEKQHTCISHCFGDWQSEMETLVDLVSSEGPLCFRNSTFTVWKGKGSLVLRCSHQPHSHRLRSHDLTVSRRPCVLMPSCGGWAFSTRIWPRKQGEPQTFGSYIKPQWSVRNLITEITAFWFFPDWRMICS